jgi:uncharacterized alkaline shock family protein YloU
MSEHPVAGGARVSRRALVDIIRPAVAGSYGVTGFVAHTTVQRLLGWLRLADPGIRVSTRDGLAIDLDLTVAFGLPVAEVARQADSAVRYALRRALGRDVDRLTIRVGGMRYAGDQPAVPPHRSTSSQGRLEDASDRPGGNGSTAPDGSEGLATLAVTVEEAE